jgi:hypothetical protein
LILALNEQDLPSRGKLKTMRTVEKSSPSIGLEFIAMKKFAPSTGGWLKLDDAACASAVTLYLSGKSLARIAPLFGISRQSLWGTFQRLKIPMRSQKRYGRENHFYRGGSKAKDAAQNKLEKAVLRGRLSKLTTCERCGKTPPPFKDGRSPIQAHHFDYSKPLEVHWLCQPCHHKEHQHV